VQWRAIRLVVDAPGFDRRNLVLLALACGLCMLTKATVYIAIVVTGAAILLAAMRGLRPGRALLALATVSLVTAMIGLPWWLRNLSIYGGTDFLGLHQHDRVVEGQPTLNDVLVGLQSWCGLADPSQAPWTLPPETVASLCEGYREMGDSVILIPMTLFTFQSFVAQFGWMTVTAESVNTPMGSLNVYALAAGFMLLTVLSLTLILAIGAARAGWGYIRRVVGRRSHVSGDRPDAHEPLLALLLLAAVPIMALAGMAWYNTKFVQPQGRYLFAALPALVTFAAIAWRPRFGVFRALRTPGVLLVIVLPVVLNAALLHYLVVPALTPL
jgi:hypothetical protein